MTIGIAFAVRGDDGQRDYGGKGLRWGQQPGIHSLAGTIASGE